MRSSWSALFVLPVLTGKVVGLPPGSLVLQFFGGTSLLIMVGVVLDVMRQVETQLLQKHYDGFLRKGKLKGRYDRLSQTSGAAPRTAIVYLWTVIARADRHRHHRLYLQQQPLIASAARPLRIVLLGPPASGKGTQGRRLAASLGLGYLSTGAVLREHVEDGTDLGKQAEPILARGEYLPDELMCPILADWLSRQTGGWVLDGFPRSLPQAVFLDDWLARRGLKTRCRGFVGSAVSTNLLARIHDRVECPECRWSGQRGQLTDDGKCPVCGSSAGRRADDSEENFRSRHAEFVQPHPAGHRALSAAGLLSPCDATAPQDEVAARLLRLFPARPLENPISQFLFQHRVPQNPHPYQVAA